MFIYKDGESYDSFVRDSFEPAFGEDVGALFSNSTISEQEARVICGDNSECLFDIALTGRASIGQATLESSRIVQQMNDNLQIGKIKHTIFNTKKALFNFLSSISLTTYTGCPKHTDL